MRRHLVNNCCEFASAAAVQYVVRLGWVRLAAAVIERTICGYKHLATISVLAIAKYVGHSCALAVRYEILCLQHTHGYPIIVIIMAYTYNDITR